MGKFFADILGFICDFTRFYKERVRAKEAGLNPAQRKKEKDSNPNESKTAIHQSAIERNERNEIKDSNPQKKENERKRNERKGNETRRAIRPAVLNIQASSAGITKRYPAYAGSSCNAIEHSLERRRRARRPLSGTVLLQKRNMKRNRRTEIASGGRYEE